MYILIADTSKTRQSGRQREGKALGTSPPREGKSPGKEVASSVANQRLAFVIEQ